MFKILNRPRSAVLNAAFEFPADDSLITWVLRFFSRANDLKLIYNTQRAVYLIFPLMMGRLGKDANDFRQDLNFV